MCSTVGRTNCQTEILKRMRCVYFCLSRNVMLTPDSVHSWSCRTLDTADSSFLKHPLSHLLWCGCQVLVLPLHRTSTFFLSSSSASLSFLIGTFWCFISTYSPWVNSSTLRDNYPRSTPQPWSRSELQILSSLPMDEGFHFSPLPCSYSNYSLTWEINATDTTTGRYSCEELIQNQIWVYPPH